MKKKHIPLRTWVQIFVTALTNGYLNGFVTGKIFTGPSKHLCTPGLNCYSCPGALFSCPIGALQALGGSRNYHLGFGVIGFLMAVGALCGRFVCGWLCPFGLIQDALFKIPFFHKIKRLPGHRLLQSTRYLALFLLVLLLPDVVTNIIGQGDPWFCKWVCPAGTLMGGLPLTTLDANLRAAAGLLFYWKVFLLAVVLFLSIVTYRPFCRYLCPLGAIYGLFNRVALVRFELTKSACVDCKKCTAACPAGIDVLHAPNSTECIRCGKCVRACPTGALHWFSFFKEAFPHGSKRATTHFPSSDGTGSQH